MKIRTMRLRFSFRIGMILCSVILFGLIFGLRCFHNPLLAMFSKNDGYIWNVRSSSYVIDSKKISCFIDGGEDENWIRDEKGEDIAFWMGGGGGSWGVGGQVMGGSKGGRDAPTPLPRAVRLSYTPFSLKPEKWPGWNFAPFVAEPPCPGNPGAMKRKPGRLTAISFFFCARKRSKKTLSVFLRYPVSMVGTKTNIKFFWFFFYKKKNEKLGFPT